MLPRLRGTVTVMRGPEISLSPRQKLEQKLSPQQLQSMAVLQMDLCELGEYIRRQAEENPLIEQEPPERPLQEFRQWQTAFPWLRRSVSTSDPDVLARYGAADPALDDLSAFLRDQLGRKKVGEPLYTYCQAVILSLDDDGYLPEEEREGLREAGLSRELLDRAIEEIQALEPAGVAAGNMAECLRLQLRRQGPPDPVAEAIAADYLPQLGKKQLSAIARALNVPLAEVRRAAERIAGLDPYPGRRFEGRETVQFIQPDVYILPADGVPAVVMNEYDLPHVALSGSYTRLLEQTEDQEAKRYLREKKAQAQWLIYNIARRGGTLRRCAEAMARRQAVFFTGQTGELRPMSAQELARELGVHPSTVSRALRGKYLQCVQGVYPLRYFCSPAVSEALSGQAVRRRILDLIREEDPAQPLSDVGLQERLQAEGVSVSRRTVTKFGQSLGIPTFGLRNNAPKRRDSQ